MESLKESNLGQSLIPHADLHLAGLWEEGERQQMVREGGLKKVSGKIIILFWKESRELGGCRKKKKAKTSWAYCFAQKEEWQRQ